MSTFNNTRVSLGQTSKHILKSKGGDSDLMRFYCTTNKTTYGRWWCCQQPETNCPKRVQSGFQSNNRAAFYYDPRLDLVDNPAFGETLKDSYESVTKRSYPWHGRSGEASFLGEPSLPEDSGYTSQSKLHAPRECEVQASRTSRRKSATTSLCKVKKDDPLRGPDPTLSETIESFGWHPLQPHPDENHSTVKDVKESGFSHNNSSMEPITFKPAEAQTHLLQTPFMTARPTGVSIMKTDYQPHEAIDVERVIPPVNCGSDLRSGFSKNNLPMEAKTCYEECFGGEQSTCLTDLSRDIYKKRSSTGFVSNRSPFVRNAAPGEFTTEYKYRYLDRTPVGVDREGHTRGQTLALQPSGFSWDTKIHYRDSLLACPLEPYEERSIVARDNHFDSQVNTVA